MKRDETGKRVHTLKESLARYMDPEAFRDRVPDQVKFTCPTMGKAAGAKLKTRRMIAHERAAAAIRFFNKPGNRERLERSAAPEIGGAGR